MVTVHHISFAIFDPFHDKTKKRQRLQLPPPKKKIGSYDIETYDSVLR